MGQEWSPGCRSGNVGCRGSVGRRVRALTEGNTLNAVACIMIFYEYFDYSLKHKDYQSAELLVSELFSCLQEGWGTETGASTSRKCLAS